MGETNWTRTNDLWLARIFFALVIGANGFSNPFLNLFFRQQGLNGTEIGLVITFSSLVGLVASPLWGRWSDAGAPLPRLLQLGLIATSAMMVVLSQQVAFAWIAFVMCIQTAVSAGIGPLSDALALRVTQARRAGYGSVRVFGSGGWAISVLTGGWVIARTSLVAGFIGSALGYAGAALLLFGVPKNLHALAPDPSRQRGGLRGAAVELFKNRALLALALALLVRGILSDGHNQFGNIFLQQLGASTEVIGIASMLASIVELPGMFIADRLVKKIGPLWTLLISFFLTGGKLFLVLGLPVVWTILVTRAIEGMAYSLYVIGIVNYVDKRTSAAQTATMLALFTVTLTELIQILGAPVGGIVFDAVGAYWLYALAVVGNFAACAILFVFPRSRT